MMNKFRSNYQCSFYFHFIVLLGSPFRLISLMMQPDYCAVRDLGATAGTLVAVDFPSFFDARRGLLDFLLNYGN